jgi:hypothetical protein
MNFKEYDDIWRLSIPTRFGPDTLRMEGVVNMEGAHLIDLIADETSRPCASHAACGYNNES